MELTFAARSGDLVLILSNVETCIYIYIFFLLFHLDTFSRELKLYHKNRKLQEIN